MIKIQYLSTIKSQYYTILNTVSINLIWNLCQFELGIYNF